MKTWIYEVIVEENEKPAQQYIGEDGQFALEILQVNTQALKKAIKAGGAKVYMTCSYAKL